MPPDIALKVREELFHCGERVRRLTTAAVPVIAFASLVYRSMASMTESFNSTAVGAQALANATSAGNIALGSFAGFNITTGANNIAIGSPGDAGDADTMRLGGGQSRTFIAGVRGVTTGAANAVAVFIDGSGQLGTASSSRRVKEDIADLGETSGVLMKLRPVSFRYKSHVASGVDEPQVGFVAEEVAEVAPYLAARATDGSIETVKYHFLAPMLVNEFQKQQRTIDAQRAELDAIRAELADLRRSPGFVSPDRVARHRIFATLATRGVVFPGNPFTRTSLHAFEGSSDNRTGVPHGAQPERPRHCRLGRHSHLGCPCRRHRDSPPAAGGVTITNAAGNATRLRVADDGTVTFPGLAALPVAGTGLCIEIATGKLGTCPAGGGSGGTVTSIIAGTGLAGGTISTTGTIGIANGGVGTAQLADGSVTLAKIAANGCANGQVLQFGGPGWTCGSVAGSSGTVTSIATGTGLTGGPITASGTIGLATTQLLPTAACSANQVPKWSGSAWACAADATGSANGFVQGGNAFGAAASIGTTDNQAVQIVANGVASLRLVPNAASPSLVAGHPGNAVTAGVGAATVAGGGSTFSSIPLPSDGSTGIICDRNCRNTVTDHGGTVGGGVDNVAGNANGALTDAPYATIAGGMRNQSTSQGSFVGGGIGNRASGLYGVVAGGVDNVAAGANSVVPGGNFNQVNDDDSFAAGRGARANHAGSFVWSGLSPSSANGTSFASLADNEFAVHAEGGVRIVTTLIPATGQPYNEGGTFQMQSSGQLTLPSLAGAIYRGSKPFLHAPGTNNAFVGVDAGNSTTSGSGNNADVGLAALRANSTGFENAALGSQALLVNTIGAGNTAVGYRALASMTESFNSTAVGAQALASATSAGNIALGSFAGFNITTGGNNIAIGSPGVAGDADTMRLGGGQSRAFIAGVRGITTGSNSAIPVLIDVNGQLGSLNSSRRFKDEIEDMGDSSGGLMHLRPVTFHYKADGDPSGKRLQYGLIAEEVAQVYPGLVARSPDGQVETVMYQFLPPMLLNEVQKQARTIEAQAAEIAVLKAQAGRLAAVEQQLAAIRQALGIR